MSLLARAQAIEEESRVLREATSTDDAANVASLKARLLERMSADRISALMAESPRRARREIESACGTIFAQGWHPELSEEQRARLVDSLIDSVFGLGPLEGPLEDEGVTEIMVNGTESFYVERGGVLERLPTPFDRDEQVRALIDRIVGPLGRRVDEASPTVCARLPQGHRVHAVIPPLALDGSVLTIRKFRDRVLTLEEMVASGSVDADVALLLEWAVVARKNIAVTGGTGSGKTTLLNALSCKIPPGERILTIEDSAELRFHEHPHVVRLEARPRNAEGVGEVTIRDLVVNALRMRPDRIVVGECRSAEALDMLQAMNTGHDGSLTTLHANSPSEAVMRLATMVRYAADLPVDVVEEQIAGAIDVVVHTSRSVDGSRAVEEVAELGYDRSERRCRAKRIFKLDRVSGKKEWASLPDWTDCLDAQGIAKGKEVEEWTARCSRWLPAQAGL